MIYRISKLKRPCLIHEHANSAKKAVSQLVPRVGLKLSWMACRNFSYPLLQLGLCLALGQRCALGAAGDFGQVAVNGGTYHLTLTFSFAGLSAAPTFSLVWNRDFQAAAPSCSVGDSTNCSVVISFSPVWPGLRQDELTVHDQSGKWLSSTPLEGIGLAPLSVLYPGIISTLAGNGVVGYQNSPNRTEFAFPQGVALDGSGDVLYVADSVNEVIRKITLSSGNVSTVVGIGTYGRGGDGGPATGASLNTPTGVAVDGGGNMYIADQGNNVIRRVDAVTQIITTVAGGGTAPSGTDQLGDGGPAVSAILSGPQSVAVDAGGNLYIADDFNNLVRTVNAATGIITVVAGGGTATGTDGFGDGGAATNAQLSNPSGVALDDSGNLYIADAGDNLVRRVDMTSGVITVVGGNGNSGYSGDGGLAKAATLSSPQGVAVDAANNVYVADFGNNAIRQIRASSQKIFTLAGSNSSGYSGDGGKPTAALLSNPTDLAVDENGNLYIADYANNVVRRVSFAASPLTFSAESEGYVSPSQVVTTLDIGDETLSLSGISLTSNFSQAPVGAESCAVGSVLTPGSTCETAVSFSPTETGAIAGSLQLTTNSLNTMATVETVNLSGTGVSAGVASLSPAGLSFAAQLIGTASALQVVTLSNTGGSPFTVAGISLSGPQASDFQISNACGTSVAAGAHCAVSITFTPTAAGARNAALLVSDSAAGSAQSVPLSGTGLGAAGRHP